MEVFVLLGVGLAAMFVGSSYAKSTSSSSIQGVVQKGGPDINQGSDLGSFDTGVTESGNTELKKKRNLSDMAEMGMTYGMEKPSNLNLTNLNEAWKPWSAPDQKPTYSIPEFYENQAEKNAWLEAKGYPFYFWKDGEIPLATNQQSNPNIELPGKESIRGDPNASLYNNYLRAYIDGGYDSNPPFSTASDRLLGAGEPEEEEVQFVPEEGKLNRDANPWGPDGVLQNIYNGYTSRQTKKYGPDQTHIISQVGVPTQRKSILGF